MPSNLAVVGTVGIGAGLLYYTDKQLHVAWLLLPALLAFAVLIALVYCLESKLGGGGGGGGVGK